MQPAAPRHFMPSAALPGAGLPSDRAALLAAERSFLLLKLAFHEAVSDLPGAEGDWLRHQVGATEDPTGLWLLRGPVFRALSGDDAEYRHRRQLLRRGLDSMFPDSAPPSVFGGLF